MTLAHAVVVVVAGLLAGTINTVVGSGTLITFPVLLAVGLPPVVANVSNTVGLVPGSLTGSWGYRAELVGQRGRLRRLGTMSFTGAVVGGLLLLRLPAAAFKAVVPVLIAVALVLVLVQPWLQARLAGREGRHADGGAGAYAGVFATGVYGGYFGAAQGVLLVGLLGSLLDEDMQRVNAAKNVLSTIVNATASVLFVLVAHVDWVAAGLVAVGAVVGGVLGSRVGRRLPPAALRAVIVVVGVAAIVSSLRSA